MYSTALYLIGRVCECVPILLLKKKIKKRIRKKIRIIDDTIHCTRHVYEFKNVYYNIDHEIFIEIC